MPAYLFAQVLGAFVGGACAHLMFGLHLFSAASHARSGNSQVCSEFVATFGLISVISGMFKAAVNFRAICRWSIYHSGILVHGIKVVCQPCFCYGEGSHGYIQWHSPH